MLAFCSCATLPGAYWVTAARNCAALSIEGVLVMLDADTLPLYSNRGEVRPLPVLVVMITTPLAALAP